MVVEQWRCGGSLIATHSLGKHCSVLLSMPLLPCEVPHTVFVETQPGALSAAGNCGSLPECAAYPDQGECGHVSGARRHGPDGLHGKQQGFVVWERVADMAGLVSGSDRMEI